MLCPMCGLGEKYQTPVEDNPNKTYCSGCKAKFFDKTRRKD